MTPAVSGAATSAARRRGRRPARTAALPLERPPRGGCGPPGRRSAAFLSAGLATTGLPARARRRPGRVKIASGKFHGLMQTNGPSGACEGPSPASRLGRVVAHRKSTASRTSPTAFAAVLPAIAHDRAHQRADALLHLVGGALEAAARKAVKQRAPVLFRGQPPSAPPRPPPAKAPDLPTAIAVVGRIAHRARRAARIVSALARSGCDDTNRLGADAARSATAGPAPSRPRGRGRAS